MNSEFKQLFKSKIVNGQLAEKYKRVFGTEDGKAVLDDLVKFCKVGESTFVPGDQHATAFSEGMRRVGLRILSLTYAEHKQKLDKSIEI